MSEPVLHQASLFQQGALEEAVAALRRDLLAENGPQISTMRNYRFAILPYRPSAKPTGPGTSSICAS